MMIPLAEISIGDILGYADNVSVVGVLVVIIWGGIKKWWVFGWQYSTTEREKNEWRELALRGTSLAEELSSEKRRVFDEGPKK